MPAQLENPLEFWVNNKELWNREFMLVVWGERLWHCWLLYARASELNTHTNICAHSILPLPCSITSYTEKHSVSAASMANTLAHKKIIWNYKIIKFIIKLLFAFFGRTLSTRCKLCSHRAAPAKRTTLEMNGHSNAKRNWAGRGVGGDRANDVVGGI